ncbi:MAG: phosphate ABC transporter permease PstA [Candidatus Eiseniibacteriota bacterium]|jgi:phosphate transport system permease protein
MTATAAPGPVDRGGPAPVAARQQLLERRLARRRRAAGLFRLLCAALTGVGVVLLAILLVEVVRSGYHWLDWQFLTSFPSRFPHKAGVKAALAGTLWLISLTACFSIPVGVAAAIYLEEYGSRGRLSRLIELNIANLAGVPSIVYGILGLAVFVRGLALERSVLAGSLTMSLLILPVIIIASREAIRAVPMSIRHAAFALGATRWQTVRHHVLPAALPGILTGVILALSRAIGETAPLIMTGALTYIAFVPESVLDPFTALPIQIFNWAARPQPEFHELAATGIILLLAVLLLMNAAAVSIRYRSQRKQP